MRTLIKNLSIITLDAEDHILSNASLLLEDDRIAAVGNVAEEILVDETIDGTDYVALPAFFNAHTHAAMTLERGWAEDLPFERWLNEKIWVAESALEEEDVYWGAALAAAEMLRAGTIGFADHYFWMDQVAQVVAESGMKALLAWCHFGGSIAAEPGQKSFEDTIAFVRRWKGAAEGRIQTCMGPHSPYMVPPDVLRRFAEAAQQEGVGVHLHVSESREQVNLSLEKYGLTPVAHVYSLGLMDLPVPALFAHCNFLLESDIDLLVEKGVTVAHTPKTYQKLAMQMPPLQAMLDAGVRCALATDGPASNSDLNMLEVMRITGLFQKFKQRNPEAMPRSSLLRMASGTGAAAIGFGHSGVIAAGHPADLILMDTRALHWIPRNDLVAGVVYTAHPSDVSYVWSNGRLLYDRGTYLTLDIERITWEAERRAFRMVGKPMNLMRSYPGRSGSSTAG